VQSSGKGAPELLRPKVDPQVVLEVSEILYKLMVRVASDGTGSHLTCAFFMGEISMPDTTKRNNAAAPLWHLGVYCDSTFHFSPSLPACLTSVDFAVCDQMINGFNHEITHSHAPSIFPGESRLAGCPLNSPSPFICELRIILGQA